MHVFGSGFSQITSCTVMLAEVARDSRILITRTIRMSECVQCEIDVLLFAEMAGESFSSPDVRVLSRH